MSNLREALRELVDMPPPPQDERGAAGWQFAMEHVKALLDSYNDCYFPGCEMPAELENRAGDLMCRRHESVVVSDSGSDADDSHLEGGHG